MNRTFTVAVSFTLGFGTFGCVFGLHQDSYGSLENYCAYLREPGHWVDSRTSAIVSLVLIAIAMTYITMRTVQADRKEGQPQ